MSETVARAMTRLDTAATTTEIMSALGTGFADHTYRYFSSDRSGNSVFAPAFLKLVHIATPDTTRLPRLPVDRRRRDAGQAGSYA